MLLARKASVPQIFTILLTKEHASAVNTFRCLSKRGAWWREAHSKPSLIWTPKEHTEVFALQRYPYIIEVSVYYRGVHIIEVSTL